MSCRRPAYVREEEVHNLILAVILSSRGAQFVWVSLVEIKGSPRYHTGRVRCCMPIQFIIICCMSSSMPDRYMELLARLIVRPEILVKLSKLDFSTSMEPMSA